MSANIQKIYDNPDNWGALQGFLSSREAYHLGTTCREFSQANPIARRIFATPTATNDRTAQLWAKCCFQKNPSQGPLLPALLPTNGRSPEIPILGPKKITATPVTPILSLNGITTFQNKPINSDEEVLDLANELKAKRAELRALPVGEGAEVQRIALLEGRISQLSIILVQGRNYTFFDLNQTTMSKLNQPTLSLPTSSLLLKRYLLPGGRIPRHIIYDVLSEELSIKIGILNDPTVLHRNVSYTDAKKKIPEIISSDYNLNVSIEKMEHSTTYQVKVKNTPTGEITEFNIDSCSSKPSVLFCNSEYLIFSNGTIYNQISKQAYQIDPTVIRNYFPCGDLDTSVIGNTLILSRGSGVDVVDLLSGELISSITLPSFLGKSVQIINVRMDVANSQIHIAAQTDQYARKFIYRLKDLSRFETVSLAMRDLLYINPSIGQIRNIPSNLATSIQNVSEALAGGNRGSISRMAYRSLIGLLYFISRFIPSTIFIGDHDPMIQENPLPYGVLTPLIESLKAIRALLPRFFAAPSFCLTVFFTPFKLAILSIIIPLLIIPGLLNTFLHTLFTLRPGTGKLINAINMEFKSLDTRLVRSINNESSHSLHIANFIAIAATTSRVALLAIQGLTNFISTTIFVLPVVTINTPIAAGIFIEKLVEGILLLGFGLGLLLLHLRNQNNINPPIEI